MGKFVITKDPEEKEESPKGRFVVTKEPKEPSQDVLPQTARGASQGALDLLSIPSLLTYPLERGTQKLLGVEDEPGRLLPGQEANYNNQSDILDRINKGEKTSFSELMMLSDDDDLMPMGSGSTSLSGMQEIQQNVPEGGLIQEGTRRVTRSLPWLAGGPQSFGSALKAEAGGLGLRETVKAMGGSDTAQMWADIIGGLGATYKRAPSSGKANIPFVAEKGGGLAASVEKLNPAAVEKRVLSLGDDIIRQAENRISDVSQQSLRDFGQFSARQTEDLITKGNRANLLNRISPDDLLPKQAWEEIKVATNDLFDAERKAYSSIYESVRGSAKKIKSEPISARDVAKAQLKKITNIETTPAGYSQVETLMRQVKKDLGIVMEGDKVITKPVSSDKLMDLSIRLNDAINYDALTPSVKDLLKPIQRAVKDDFRQAISQRPSVLEGFNKAEELYKTTANRFNKDSIAKLRSTENAEFVGNDFLNSSNFENFQKVFGKNSPQVSAAERQIVDLIGKQGQKQAQETLRQLEPYLSQKAKTSAHDLMDLGDKLTTKGQRRALQQKMLTDTADSISAGTRPNLTLTAMRTPDGYQIAKDAFSRTNQGKRLFKVMEKQVVEDLFSSITKEGKIDWDKARKILDDPGYRQVMENIMGMDGVQFIRNIEKWSGNIVQNLADKKLSQPSSWANFINVLDTPLKGILTLLLGSQFGILAGVGTVAGLNYGIKGVSKIMTSPAMRNAVKDLGKTQGKDLLKVANILNAELQDS